MAPLLKKGSSSSVAEVPAGSSSSVAGAPLLLGAASGVEVSGNSAAVGSAPVPVPSGVLAVISLLAPAPSPSSSSSSL